MTLSRRHLSFSLLFIPHLSISFVPQRHLGVSLTEWCLGYPWGSTQTALQFSVQKRIMSTVGALHGAHVDDVENITNGGESCLEMSDEQILVSSTATTAAAVATSSSSPLSPPPLSTTPSKFHHFTVCMVPSDHEDDRDAERAWEELTKARTELRDPGLFRWPPHANLLYPFLDPRSTTVDWNDHHTVDHQNQENDDHDPGLFLDSDILQKLQSACRQVEPFTVFLNRLGTFGGAKRGVLWMYPTTATSSSSCFSQIPLETSTTCAEPLVVLQGLLQESFPFCNDQQKSGGSFHPHMTLSHFVNLDAALQAQSHIETWWDPSISFLVEEIYLLYRQGDGGQFERLASIGLGQQGKVRVHNPPLPFSYMPRQEVDWVKEERLQLKQRRNKGKWGGGQKRSSRRRTDRSRSPPDTPEMIAQKRAERKAKRDAQKEQESNEP